MVNVRPLSNNGRLHGTRHGAIQRSHGRLPCLASWGPLEVTISATDATYRFFQRQVDISNLQNPLFSEVLDVWNSLRSGAIAPPWRVADLLRYPSSVIPFISIVDLLPNGEFRYRYWGTGHVDVKGYDYTGQSPLAHEPPEYGRMINDEYTSIVAAGHPMAFIHDIRPGLAQVSKYQETLRLPLSNDGISVSGVISFADWLTNSGQWTEMFDTLSDPAATHTKSR